jgi:multiple sugar transport system substrate-binding protein
MARAIATFSCAEDMHKDYHEGGFEDSEVLYVERDQNVSVHYIGFDYRRCGKCMADLALASKYTTLALVTDTMNYSNERIFSTSFMEAITASGASVSINHIQTDISRRTQNAMQLFETGIPQAVFVSNYGFAETLRDVQKAFYSPAEAKIFTLSPLFTMPEANFIKYELNYRLMGKKAAETLISHISHRTSGHRVVLENSGFRSWEAAKPQASSPSAGGILPLGTSHLAYKKESPCINMLTLDSPEASAIKYLARLYTQSTQIKVNISVCSYDEMHEIVAGMDESSIYDVIRLDVTWLSWFAAKILLPLENISGSLNLNFDSFVNGISKQYFYVQNTLYGLPISPSAQVLFYRKDLFESTVIKRLYQEAFKKPLSLPTSFEDYNQIARFFTKSLNPQSPVDYGTTLTLGSTGVAGTEFLTRYFAKTRALFDKSGQILLDSEEAHQSLDELLEAKRYAKPRYCPWWTHAAQEFSEGNVAMTILYSNFASEIINRNSKVVNKVGYALVPGASPIIGGGSLGVCRFSKHPELALSFIQWLGSEPISSATMFLGSVSACKKSYENYEIIDSYPWLDLAKDCFALSANKRTPYEDFSPFDERRFLGILGLEIKNAYNEAISSSEALEKAKKSYERQFGH